MRKEIKNILKKLIEYRDRVIIDNDFERAYNIIPIEAKKTDLLETIYIFEAILKENEIDIDKIYED